MAAGYGQTAQLIKDTEISIWGMILVNLAPYRHIKHLGFFIEVHTLQVLLYVITVMSDLVSIQIIYSLARIVIITEGEINIQ